MTSEIDCTTRTKQKSTLSVDTLYRTRVRMLGPTLVPSVNSIVRTVIVTRKLQSLAATAAACEVHWETQYGPLAHVRGDSSWPCFRNIGSTREYLGSNNSQSALGQYSVHLSAPFLVTVGAIWAVSRDCSDCGRKQILPITATPESVGMVSLPVHVSRVAVLCTSHAAAFAAGL